MKKGKIHAIAECTVCGKTWQKIQAFGDTYLAVVAERNVLRAEVARLAMVASNHKNVAAQCAVVLATLAQDERLDHDTREAAGRTFLSAKIAHNLESQL